MIWKRLWIGCLPPPWSAAQWSLNLKTDAFDISGQLTTKVDELPGTHDADSNEFIFNIGNDPVANKAGMNFSFVHNNKNMIKLDATSKYSEKDFDFSQFKTSGSLLDVLMSKASVLKKPGKRWTYRASHYLWLINGDYPNSRTRWAYFMQVPTSFTELLQGATWYSSSASQ